METGSIVKNSGNVPLTVAAKAYFSDFRGRDSELDLGQVVILHGSEGVLKGDWQEAPFFGRVRVTIVIGYFNEQGELINKSQQGEFWVIPWKLLAAIVGILSSLILLIWLSRKRYRLRLERR